MEFSAKVTRVERALFAVFLAMLAGTFWLESRSGLAAAVRSGQPFLCWLDFGAPAGRLYLAVLQPARRAMDLVYFPAQKEVALEELLPLAKGTEFPRLALEPESWPPSEPPLDAEDWLLERTQGLGLWRFLARRLLAGSPPTLDELFLLLDLHRMDPGRLRAAWLPDGADDRRALFGRIFSAEARAEVGAATVEILNAAGRAGVASSAKDVLRLQGVDVVNVGNWSGAPRGRTVVYDRTGRVQDAEAVRDRLGCRQTPVVTRISPKKLVDVTVVLAEDCASPELRGTKWNLSKY
ncbi:MAG: LytR C-terminal domain-containing protein [Elusimicrobia bacterium]|nr:LytR C-terminal domain-containing protein [Elusimicrobiota bacterium]